jgi:ABC-type polysaccharide/polyol phosphate transport system ATPase subunit
MKEFYTIKELSDTLSVSIRTVQRHLKNLYKTNEGKVLIPLDVVNLLKMRHGYDNNYDTDATQKYDVIEGFSNEEYQEFQKRLIEYPILQKDLEYHRNSAQSHQRQMEMILRNLVQRNFIEAKDKKLV